MKINGEPDLNQANIIGSFSVEPGNAATAVLNLAAQFGMSNPSQPVNSNSKGIVIKKNGKRYTIILGMFTPPIILSWTAPFNLEDFNKILETLSKQNKTIGYINTLNIKNSKYIQIAIS